MIGKNTIKLIKSLSDKKNRLKEGLFVVEGDKIVKEVLNSKYHVKTLFATSEFLETNSHLISGTIAIFDVSKTEIAKASFLKTPQNCIAICDLPDVYPLPSSLKSLSIFLDDIQDPGNMGTIIRNCDWFGVTQLFCSPGSADLYNPKVIQSSMGSFCRVDVITTEFETVCHLSRSSGTQIMGSFLEGDNIFTKQFPADLLLVMGNEGNGISSRVAACIDIKMNIPQFSIKNKKADSLNVAIATAVFCAEYRRQISFGTYSK